MKKFSYKFFEGQNLLAIADKEILGKTFKSKEVYIDISKNFYHQGFCDEKTLVNLIKKSSIVNAMGKNCIKFLIENKLVDKENVIKPCGVPHAQIITF